MMGTIYHASGICDLRARDVAVWLRIPFITLHPFHFASKKCNRPYRSHEATDLAADARGFRGEFGMYKRSIRNSGRYAWRKRLPSEGAGAPGTTRIEKTLYAQPRYPMKAEAIIARRTHSRGWRAGACNRACPGGPAMTERTVCAPLGAFIPGRALIVVRRLTLSAGVCCDAGGASDGVISLVGGTLLIAQAGHERRDRFPA